MGIRFFITLLFISLSFNAFSYRLETHLTGSHVGYAIVDLRSGQVITSLNDNQLFVPASTLKCVTTAVALSKLGADFKYVTNIYTTGVIEGDSLRGNVLIEPAGDPSLDGALWADIANAGISHIVGSVEVLNCDEPIINGKVMHEDVGTEYCAGWTRFIYNNNRALINETSQAYPLQYIIDEFIDDMFNYNIIADKTNVTHSDTTLIASHYSKSLKTLCREMMVKSENLYAEAIGRTLSPVQELDASLDTVSVFLQANGLTDKSFHMVDFCGLSRTNYITPGALARLLAKMSGNKDFVETFPRAGIEGTLKRFLNGSRLKGKLALKSGSMSGILAYAGYKLDSNQRSTHAIVIFTNNNVTKQSDVKRCIETWLLNIF